MPWAELAYGGGGYWRTRVPVVVTGEGAHAPSTGVAPVKLDGDGPTAVLTGAPVSELRVATADGTELLYGLSTADGLPKRSGILRAGDCVDLPLHVTEDDASGVVSLPTADARSTTTAAGENDSRHPGRWRTVYYLYTENPDAWGVPEWLASVRLQNRDFEMGEDSPAGWQKGECDETHRMFRQKGGARSGQSCVRCEVDDGAKPTWVKYMQNGITIRGGGRYRFTGWVKAEDVKGSAGWYVHVHGQGKLVLNRTVGEGGTFDWRKETVEFTAPPEATTLSCGTVLHGTGTAWFDDVSLEWLDGGGAPDVQVGAAERRKLRSMGRELPWPRETGWGWRVPLQVRNFSARPSDRSLMRFDSRRLDNQLSKVMGFDKSQALRLVDPRRPGEPLSLAGSLQDTLLAIVDLPPMSELTLWLFVSDDPSAAGASAAASLRDWAAEAGLNLLRNGAMDASDGTAVEGWRSDVPSGENAAGVRAERVRRSEQDAACLRLQVPAGVANPGWTGWRQQVPVQPNTAYLLAGDIRTEGADTDVHIHGHLHRADGKLTANAFFSTGPGVSGTRDWTRTSASFRTPVDCASVSVHLTMNGHGTVWHDNVLLARTAEGAIGDLEARRAPRGLTAWPVNPLVKVFREDLPPADGHATTARVHAPRNSRRAFQVAIRSPVDARPTVTATRLQGPGGATLAAPRVYRVDYVPIDFPVGYAGSQAPATHRLRPTQRGNDGWAGQWPDPLVPLASGGTIQLSGGRTQPLRCDVTVPLEAVPGRYTGAVKLDCNGTSLSLPVVVDVWRFALPDHPRLPAIYDLRNGGGVRAFDAGDEQSLRKWCAFLSEYNISPGICVVQPRFSYADGVVKMDTAAFDRMTSYLLDELGVAKLYTPWFFYACGWAYAPKKVFGFEAFSEDYNRAWTAAYRQFVDHITARGWRDRFVFYISDEPHASSERTITGLARLADMAKEIAPDVPIYSSTWRYIQGLEDHITLWGIGIHGSFPQDKVEERRGKGDHFWYTTDGHMCTDTPYLAVETLLPWFCFKYGCDAYEFWGVSWWTHDPWKYGWHTFIRQSSDGVTYRWVRYPNGDGFLTYPGTGHGHDGPLPSIRLMAAREGVDDYEVFVRLRKYADAGNEQARQALENVRSLVNTPNRGGRYSTDIMPDPDAVLAARIAAGETLNTLFGTETRVKQ